MLCQTKTNKAINVCLWQPVFCTVTRTCFPEPKLVFSVLQAGFCQWQGASGGANWKIPAHGPTQAPDPLCNQRKCGDAEEAVIDLKFTGTLCNSLLSFLYHACVVFHQVHRSGIIRHVMLMFPHSVHKILDLPASFLSFWAEYAPWQFVKGCACFD